MDTAKVKEYLSLDRRRDALAAELKVIEQDLKLLERVVVDMLVNSGLDAVVADGRKLKLVPDIFPSPMKDRWDVVAALKEAGLDQYIPENYNDAQLRSFVREIATEVLSRAQEEQRPAGADEIRAALPEPLGRALKVYVGHKLSNTKA